MVSEVRQSQGELSHRIFTSIDISNRKTSSESASWPPTMF